MAGIRFYGFDSMAKTLNLQATHIMTDHVLGTTDYSATSYVNDIVNYTALNTALITRISKITSIKYLPAFNSATTPINTDRENSYYIEFVSNQFVDSLINLINIKDDVYLDFSKQELVSTGFYKTLDDTVVGSASPAFIFYGGDSFINKSSFIRMFSGTPAVFYVPTENILNAGLRYEGNNDIEKCYPYTDIAIREGAPLEYTYISQMITANSINYYVYSDFCHLVNNLRQDNIDSDLTEINNKFPNVISSSIAQPDSSNSMFWRIFKVLDKYNLNRDKGSIYKIIGNDYILFIQTEYSLFRGLSIDTLKAENITVALKTTDIFERPPEEINSNGDFIRPWNREGIILTPFGLVVVDLNRGSIYLVTDKVIEISKFGIEDWFRKVVTKIMTINSTSKEKVGYGVSLGYDDLYKRLLVTVRNENIAVTSVTVESDTTTVTVVTTSVHNLTTGDTIRLTGWSKFTNGTFIITVTNSTTFIITTTSTSTGTSTGGTLKTIDDITLSYSFEEERWICFHSYIPDRYIWNTNGLYYTISNNLYKANFGNFGYFNSSYNDSIIDFIFNSNSSERFLLKNVRWVSSIELNGILYWDQTINKLMIYSKNLSTGEITLSKRSFAYTIVVTSVTVESNQTTVTVVTTNVHNLSTGTSIRMASWSKGNCNGTFIITVTNTTTFTYTITTTTAGTATGGTLTTDIIQQTGNTRFKDGEWVFNDITDILATPNSIIIDGNFNKLTASENTNKLWNEKSKFITKFIIVRMIYNNIDNKKLRISNININAKTIL